MFGLKINRFGLVAQLQEWKPGKPRVRLVGPDRSGTWFSARGTWVYEGLV
jgi:hypothetical protein